MSRVRRELLESDEIGMSLSEIPGSRRRIMELTVYTVPETPDAVLRPTRMSLPTGKESSPRNGSPTRLLRKAQPPDRTRTTSTSLAAALHGVHDVLAYQGLSQIPATELADSARLLDDANKQLRRALARNTSNNVAI